MPYGKNSRVDFLLHNAEKRCYLEIKSVTLLQEDTYLFPDAKTIRGKKHIEELVAMTKEGHRAILLFMVQREDGTRFAPAAEIDPAYAKALKKGIDEGLEVLVYQAEINPEKWVLSQALPWSLSPDGV